jgi:hypothetical protein
MHVSTRNGRGRWPKAAALFWCQGSHRVLSQDISSTNTKVMAAIHQRTQMSVRVWRFCNGHGPWPLAKAKGNGLVLKMGH